MKKCIKKIIFFLILFFLVLLLIFFLVKFRSEGANDFILKIDNSYLVESYETNRGIHGDGLSLKHFELNQEEFKDIKKYLEEYDFKKISSNKKKYYSYLNGVYLKRWSETLMSIEEGFFYIIDRSPSNIERVTNFDLIILDTLNQSVYYIKSDS